MNENPKFFDQDFNLIADWQECVGNSVGTDCALVAGNATLVNKDALYFVSTIYDHNNLYKLENGNIELVFEFNLSHLKMTHYILLELMWQVFNNCIKL